jgi:hypothetical protein
MLSTAEKLSELFLKLVSDDKGAAFVAALLATKAGTWVAMTDLCREVPEALDALRAMNLEEYEPVATWLGDPFENCRRGYCLIVCYWEQDFFTKTVLFNRAGFDERRAAARSSMTLLR